jgi:hypothetical protein
MDRVPVVSSCIASVGYEAPTQTLELEFTNGRVYRYFGIPARVHAELIGAESKGTYFNRCIRDRPGVAYEEVL